MTAWKAAVVSLVTSLVAAGAEAGVGPLGHEFMRIPVPGAGSIAVTPTGDVWFTGFDLIGRLRGGLVTEFATPTAISSPLGITQGPDGNLWFAQYNSGAIGRITPNGTITEFPLPAGAYEPSDVHGGPDGNVWFTALGTEGGVESGRVGRITPQGTFSLFVTEQDVQSLTLGPDGALWFTAVYGGIGRMATNGQSRFFPFDRDVGSLATGADGALWFTAGLDPDYTVGRMTTDGAISTFTAPSPTGEVGPIVRGPEDNQWFTAYNGGVWRINLAGTIEEILPPAAAGGPTDITVGADGRIWFSQSGGIVRLDSLAFGKLDVPGSSLYGLARGADDSIWFADAFGRIGRIGADGSFVQHELDAGHRPTAVAVGADGSAWFTDPGTDTIGHIALNGDRVLYTIPSPPSGPQDIVLGPDGNYWFTEYDAASLGRITPQGVIRRFPVDVDTAAAVRPRAASVPSQPLNLAVGPDGNLWFTDGNLNQIGRMTTGGEVVVFPIPTQDSFPSGIAAGWDGNLYFTEAGAGRVARITTDGVITELGTPEPGSFPEDITLGPDGAMWFTDPGYQQIGRIARDGRITRFALPDDIAGPTGIVGRSDGRLYVALNSQAQIAFTDLAAAEPTRTATPAVPTPTPTIGTVDCFGDCNGDAAVSIAELISAVSIALGSAPFESCANADADGDGTLQINDLIASVTSALQGCSP